MQEDDNNQAPARESIWSVETGVKNFYYALFTLLVILGVALLTLDAVSERDDWLDITLTIWQGVAWVVVASAGVSLAAIELGRFIMVLARALQDRLDKNRERRLAEARDEGRDAVLALLDEDTRKEVERKLRRDGNADADSPNP